MVERCVDEKVPGRGGEGLGEGVFAASFALPLVILSLLCKYSSRSFCVFRDKAEGVT